MTFSRNEILKAWEEAVGELARDHDNPTDEEIVAATAAVCGKYRGVTPDDIRDALRANVEEVQRQVVAADRTLQILKTMLAKGGEGMLPGLPGGPPLKRQEKATCEEEGPILPHHRIGRATLELVEETVGPFAGEKRSAIDLPRSGDDGWRAPGGRSSVQPLLCPARNGSLDELPRLIVLPSPNDLIVGVTQRPAVPVRSRGRRRNQLVK
jgi:hypothetical protein